MQFHKGGQTGFYHTENNLEGIFHTYDNFQLPNHHSHKIHLFLPSDYENSGTHYKTVRKNTFCSKILDLFKRWALCFLERWRRQQKLGNASNVNQTVPTRPLQNLANRHLPKRQRRRIHPHQLASNKVQISPFRLSKSRKYGGIETYSKFLVELKQWVDQNYRTLPEPSNTSITGKRSFVNMSHPRVFPWRTCSVLYWLHFSRAFWLYWKLFSLLLGWTQSCWKYDWI